MAKGLTTLQPILQRIMLPLYYSMSHSPCSVALSLLLRPEAKTRKRKMEDYRALRKGRGKKPQRIDNGRSSNKSQKKPI